jgi:hypothetical protein
MDTQMDDPSSTEMDSDSHTDTVSVATSEADTVDLAAVAAVEAAIVPELQGWQSLGCDSSIIQYSEYFERDLDIPQPIVDENEKFFDDEFYEEAVDDTGAGPSTGYSAVPFPTFYSFFDLSHREKPWQLRMMGAAANTFWDWKRAYPNSITVVDLKQYDWVKPVRDFGQLQTLIVQKLKNNPCYFKVGITANPINRWEGMADRDRTMRGLSTYSLWAHWLPTLSAEVSGELEKLLVEKYRGTQWCKNQMPGGEGQFPAHPHWLYVA